CSYCSNELEHRDHRLAKHIASTTKCKQAPAAAWTAAHVLMAGKKGGTKRPAEDADAGIAPSAESSSVVRDPDAPLPKKKGKTQSNLDGVVDRPMTKTQEDSANRKLLRYLIHSNTAFVQADSIFLGDFTNELRPSFQIASR
ncbi:hypothetical protein GGX14DRAFT_317031, partial [Mycena pura]